MAKAHRFPPHENDDCAGDVIFPQEKNAAEPKVAKAELIAIAKPFYFTHHHGQHAITSSVEARSADGKVPARRVQQLQPGHQR